MTFDELADYISQIPEMIQEYVPEIVAETAVEYFKGSFDRKAFDGNPWQEAKKPRPNGSLLVDSGTLVNSIEPTLISAEKVVISAGHTKAPYAKAHNEGFNGVANVKPFTRNSKSRTVDVPEYTRRGKVVPAHKWDIPGGEQSVRAHNVNMNLPKRQFMGHSEELNLIIKDRIDKLLNSKLQ